MNETVTLTDSELKWLLTSPDAIRALADYHDLQQSMGESQGIDCSANEARRKWFSGEAERIESEWQAERDVEPRIKVSP